MGDIDKMANFNYDYSEYSDILHVHQKGEETKGSVEIGDFTLDFGKYTFNACKK